ncbi:MAG: hypothetical protein ACLP72_15545 [Candidatus Sulfotelmatobacter sp.]
MLAIPVGLAAQDSQAHKSFHRYQLVDMGTFGGPQSSIVDQGVPSGVSVNNGGVFAGYADTSELDPFQDFCFLDCFVDHAFQWQDGVMSDLGVLHHGLSSAAVAISANGLIAGFAQNGEFDPLFAGFPGLRAVLWQNGGITDLGTLPEGGYESAANAVNSSGQVVGVALNTTPDPNSLPLNNVAGSTQVRAFFWEEGVMRDLGTLGGPDAVASLINERGQVMGWSYTSSTEPGVCFPLALGSFIWEKEKGMTNVGSLGGTCTEAADLNNRGQVVGTSFVTGDTFQRAFLSEHGSIQELGGSLGGDITGADAINDAGQVDGFAFLAGDTLFHATLWTRVGQITDLGTVGTDACSYAGDINAKGQIVGGSFSLSACLSNGDPTRAFLWEDGAIFDLNTLIPPGSALYLLSPDSINDRGEIAGTGVDANGNEHAFLLIPCDENHPGVEGCDYSMVDATSATQSPAPRYEPSGTQRPSQWRRTNRYHIPVLEAPGR